MIWGGLHDLGSNEPNWCEPNQSTYKQCLPKVCLQQFHGQDEDWFGIFWALLVHFGLGIMCEEGICQIWIFGFFEVKKVKFGSVEKMGYKCKNVSVSQKAQIFGKRSILMKCSILYGGWEVAFNFWFLKIFIWLLGRAKVWLKKLFFMENLKMDTRHFF